MAWTRSPRGRRRGRRFVRRRGFRQTTEAGARIERCHFNLGVDQPISNIPSAPTYDAVMLAGTASLSEGLAPAGTQAQAVARVLALPLRSIDVSGLTFDVECQLSSGTAVNDTPGAELDTNTTVIQAGFAVYTQRLDGSDAPVVLPPYDLTQWPVNSTSGFTDATQDNDYATRTHFHRAFALAPHELQLVTVDPAFYVLKPQYPHYRFSAKVRVKRKLSDNYALFFGFWVKTPGPLLADLGGIDSAFWRVTGSLWYKMRW